LTGKRSFFRLHLQRGVICKYRLPGADMTGDGVGKWFQQRSRTSDPVGQSRTIKVDPFALVDAGLAIQRERYRSQLSGPDGSQ